MFRGKALIIALFAFAFGHRENHFDCTPASKLNMTCSVDHNWLQWANITIPNGYVVDHKTKILLDEDSLIAKKAKQKYRAFDSKHLHKEAVLRSLVDYAIHWGEWLLLIGVVLRLSETCLTIINGF